MRKIPKVLTEDQQQALLQSFNERYVTPKRNKLMVRLMLNAGLRLAETLDLDWSNLDTERAIVDVRAGKGDKDRRLFLDEQFATSLSIWERKEVEWLGEQPNYVFTTGNNTRINPRYVRAMVKRQCNRADLPDWVHPHTFRHTFATDLYKKSKDIRMVQKALGHADLSTTMIYTHIVDDELEDALKSFRARKEPVKA